MPAPTRVITSPVRLTGRLSPGQLAVLVAADAVARRAETEGNPGAWTPVTLAGDLTVQLAVERDLARHGLDRAALGPVEFGERVRAHEATARLALVEELAELRIGFDVDLAAAQGEAAADAARTAFVRLFDTGLLEAASRVVDLCPRCGTVVDTVDADPAELPASCLTIRLPLAAGEGTLDVDTVAPELLPGAVAVVVGDGHPAAGENVVLPIVGREVPVVAESEWEEEPLLLVPGHDPMALEVAQRHGLTPIVVLDADAVVREGPLAGLPRYAARAAATDLLTAEGALGDCHDAVEAAARHRRCTTVLLPQLGRHWFLSVGDLEGAAADAIREGTVTFTPPGLRDEFLARAGEGGTWCMSHQLATGPSVPVARCADCGQVAVAADPGTSCGKCMGTLVPDDGVLDGRFVGAMAALSSAGWPGDEGGPGRLAPDTALVAGRGAIARWILPMAALGLRLAGALPFSTVSCTDLVEVDEVEGEPGVVRLALLSGDADLDAATELAARLTDPPEGDADVDALVDAYDAAFAAAAPAQAVPLLIGAMDTGVPATATDRLRALAAPLLGE